MSLTFTLKLDIIRMDGAVGAEGFTWLVGRKLGFEPWVP